MSRLVDFKPPPDERLEPATSHGRKRRLGLMAGVVVALLLGWSAWHYTHRVPTPPSNSVPLTERGLR